MMFERVLLIFKETWRSIFASASVLLFISVLMLSFAALTKNIPGIADALLGLNHYTVYLKHDVASDRKAKLLKDMKNNPRLREVKLFESNEVKGQIRKRFPDISKDLESVGAENFPSYIDFRIINSTRSKIRQELSNIKLRPEVEQVIGNSEQPAEMQRIIKAASLGGYSIMLVLLIIFAAAAYMLIQQNLFLGYDEIRIMRMLGAETMQTMLPYIIHALLVCLGIYFLAMYFSMLFVGLVLAALTTNINRDALLASGQFFSVNEIALSIALVFLICLVGGVISGVRSIRGIERLFI